MLKESTPFKIALIGANSFLARAIAAYLACHYPHAEIIAYRRKAPAYRFEIPQHGVDQMDLSELRQCDAIVYCAGAGIQPNLKVERSLQEKVNASEPIKLIGKLERAGYSGQLITFGSYFELGDIVDDSAQGLLPKDECYFIQHSNELPNDYAQSKRHLSQYIAQRGNSLTSYRLLHLVLSNVYGAGENQQRLLPYLARQMAAGGQIALTSGSQLRQYTHARDIAGFIADRVLGSEAYGIYNFTDPTVISVRSLVERFCQLAGFCLDDDCFAQIEKRDSRLKYLALDTQKAERQFGRFNFSAMDDNLREYLDEA